MDSNYFARISQDIAGSTRRRILGFGSAGVLGLLGSRLGATEAEAKKRKKKRKKRKQTTPLQLAFRCPGPSTFIGSCANECRVAQVFRATRNGRLARIQFHVDKPIDSTGDYVVQLLQVDNSDTPLHTPFAILAAIAIPDAEVPVGESLLTADFSGPHLEAQTDYAAVIGRAGLQTRVGTVAGTTCGGELFRAHGLEPFESGSLPTSSSPFSSTSGALLNAVAGCHGAPAKTRSGPPWPGLRPRPARVPPVRAHRALHGRRLQGDGSLR